MMAANDDRSSQRWHDVGFTAPGILRVPGDRECDLVEESLQSGAGRQARVGILDGWIDGWIGDA